MSLDKAIEHGKEHRKQYYGAKSIDATCRPHGGCPWCEGNRLHKNQKRMGAYDSIVTGLTEAIEYEEKTVIEIKIKEITSISLIDIQSDELIMGFEYVPLEDYRCTHCGEDLSLEEVQYDVNGDESCENCINSYE